MKQCNNKCHLQKQKKITFGNSPGRCSIIKRNKNCKVCGIWISSEEKNCFCCGNKFHIHKKLLKKNMTIDSFISIPSFVSTGTYNNIYKNKLIINLINYLIIIILRGITP